MSKSTNKRSDERTTQKTIERCANIAYQACMQRAVHVVVAYRCTRYLVSPSFTCRISGRAFGVDSSLIPFASSCARVVSTVERYMPAYRTRRQRDMQACRPRQAWLKRDLRLGTEGPTDIEYRCDMWILRTNGVHRGTLSEQEKNQKQDISWGA